MEAKLIIAMEKKQDMIVTIFEIYCAQIVQSNSGHSKIDSLDSLFEEMFVKLVSAGGKQKIIEPF